MCAGAHPKGGGGFLNTLKGQGRITQVQLNLLTGKEEARMKIFRFSIIALLVMVFGMAGMSVAGTLDEVKALTGLGRL